MGSQENWEGRALELGYKSEKEMWESLYKTESLTQIAARFNRGINTIRARFEKHGITFKARGGPHSTKVEMSAEFIDDVVNLGVMGASKKYGVKPQAIYQRLYYKLGMTVKQVREMARQGKQSPSSPGCDSEPQLSEENPPPSPKGQ